MSTHASMEAAAELPQLDLGRPAPGRLGQWAAFYLGMPLLLAIPLGWYGAGIASQASRPVGLLLWSLIVCLSWWCSDLCTRLLARATGSQRPHRAWLLVGGFCINIVLARYHSPAVIAACLQLGLAEPTPVIVRFMSTNRDLLDLHYLSGLLTTGVPGLVFWLAGNLAFERYRETAGMTRAARRDDGARLGPPATGATVAHPRLTTLPTAFAVAEPPHSSSTPASPAQLAALPQPLAHLPASARNPRFFQRLSRLAGLDVDELVAVEAEDHYIQVHSIRGKELVYYRFRDALQELESVPGLQIHRSAWVSRRHVTALDGRGRKLEVVLVTGDRLPVSLSNRGALLQAGLQPH